MIESWEDRASKLLRKRSAEARREFRAAVRPMYRNSDSKPRLHHVGSCILLRVDGLPILSTAAHILDSLTTGYTLYVGGQGETSPVRIRGGQIGATPKPAGDRDLDHYDCGFWRIPEDAFTELGDVEFVDAAGFSDDSVEADRRYYTAMGYRLKRNRSAIDHRAKRISNHLSTYSGSVTAVPNLAEKLGVSGAEHMFMPLPKFGQTEDDARVNTFGPVGFSGGPLLDLGDFTLEEAYRPDYPHRPTLSGMMIAHYPRFRAMGAVKIGIIVEAIRRRLRRPSSPVRFEVLK